MPRAAFATVNDAFSFDGLFAIRQNEIASIRKCQNGGYIKG